MLPGYIVFLLLVAGLIYLCSNQNSQVASTASAIRQVWSGGCRLNCRQSSYSGVSGLSSLQTRPQYQAGPSRDCVCDSCPCNLIEHVLNTCSPATQVYTSVSEALSHCINNVVKMITGSLDYFNRVLECGASCQRQAQIVDGSSSENFSFTQRDRDGRDEISENIPIGTKQAASKQSLAGKKSSVIFKETKINKSDGSYEEKKKEPSDEAMKSSSDINCPKCVKKGKICLRECPRAKK